MQKQLTKGNEAIVKAAVLAGCRAYYGYPITPASEIAEAASLYLRRAGGVFVQAESEVAAINMLYGGAAAEAEAGLHLVAIHQEPDSLILLGLVVVLVDGYGELDLLHD